MSNGPTALFDKSVIQMLSQKEAEWFFHFFRGILTPVFLAETLGNLAKSFSDGRDPARMVSSLASKTDSFGIMPNVSHVDLVNANMFGGYVDMSYSPIVGNAQLVTADNGEQGWFIDETPEERVIKKWRNGEFEAAELEQAKNWRISAQNLNYQPYIDAASDVPIEIEKEVSALRLEDFRVSVSDSLSDETYAFKGLSKASSAFRFSSSVRRELIRHWDKRGRPPMTTYAPYASFVMCMMATSMMGIGRKIISSRPNNFIDEQYIYYLPFCQAFVSNDTMHRQLASVFMDQNQLFIWGSDLKKGLKELEVYYDDHKAELATQGSMKFAAYPPLELNTSIHAAYDKLVPDWRIYAAAPAQPPITKEENERIMAKLKPMLDAMDLLPKADI